MYWQFEIPIIVRNLINDMEDTPRFSDGRIQQMSIVAARYVLIDLNTDITYTVDTINQTITPDPSDPATRDTDFISFWALKTACLLDQSEFRTKAITNGIRTTLGSASLDISNNLNGYKTILDIGPCSTYDQLVLEYNLGHTNILHAVLSPFVGNNFDPQMLNTGRSDYRRVDKLAT